MSLSHLISYLSKFPNYNFNSMFGLNSSNSIELEDSDIDNQDQNPKYQHNQTQPLNRLTSFIGNVSSKFSSSNKHKNIKWTSIPGDDLIDMTDDDLAINFDQIAGQNEVSAVDSDKFDNEDDIDNSGDYDEGLSLQKKDALLVPFFSTHKGLVLIAIFVIISIFTIGWFYYDTARDFYIRDDRFRPIDSPILPPVDNPTLPIDPVKPHYSSPQTPYIPKFIPPTPPPPSTTDIYPKFQQYDTIRYRVAHEANQYSQFSTPPRLLPPMDLKTRQNLVSNKIVEFSINTKISILTNTFFPTNATTLDTQSVIQRTLSLPNVEAKSSSTFVEDGTHFSNQTAVNSTIQHDQHFYNPNSSQARTQTRSFLDYHKIFQQSKESGRDSTLFDQFDDLVNASNYPITTTNFSTQNENKPDFGTTVSFIPWSEYLDLVKKNETTDQPKKYQAQYATHISLDTTPPTIRFIPNFYLNNSTQYFKRSKINSPDPHKIAQPLNFINTTNPFSEYLKFETRVEKLSAVKREISHAFGGYFSYAFGMDEFFPVSFQGVFGWGIGLTVVDSLDTLMLAGNEEFVEECLRFIADRLKFSPNQHGSLFETVIRGLGGLLSAYAIRPEHTVLLERAVELGDFLLSAFDSKTGLWSATVQFGAKPRDVSSSVVAEILTLQIEMETLSRYCGDIKYALAARKTIAALYKMHPNLLSPMLILSKKSLRFSEQTITLGGRVDSAYEYFIKLWVLHGKVPYKLELRPHLNSTSSDERTGISWLGNSYSPQEQDQLWYKFRGLYDPATGIYAPLDLYYSFILHVPSLLVNAAHDEFLAPILIRGTTIDSNHDHLNCFLAGVLAYGIAHGVYNDHATIAEIYQADCVFKGNGIPCDFITPHNAPNQSIPYKYLVEIKNNETSTPQTSYPFFNAATDTQDIASYVKEIHSQWAAELAYTCVATYTTVETQLGPEISSFYLHPSVKALYKNITQLKAPIIQDLYTHFRTSNALIGPQKIKNSYIIPTNLVQFPGSFSERTHKSAAQFQLPGGHWAKTVHFTQSNSKILTPLEIPPVIMTISGNKVNEPKVGSFMQPGGRVNLVRPETVESLFVLWRLTRNEYYRETIWAIFLQFVYYSRVFSGGYTSLANVQTTGFHRKWFNTTSTFELSSKQDPSFILMPSVGVPDTTPFSWQDYHSIEVPYHELMNYFNETKQKTVISSGGRMGYGSGPLFNTTVQDKIGDKILPRSWKNSYNKMESFALSETLKYVLLAFDDEQIPLDQWVFNTEAHPVRILY